jgi:hypothetical protein
MAWHYVAAHLLQQDRPDQQKVLYWDDSLTEHGELLLWLDDADDVARFQLTWQPFQEPAEHLIEWRREQGLRAGTVASERDRRGLVAAPTVHYSPLEPAVLAGMRAYLAQHAPALPPRHRTAVVRALASAASSA